MRSGGRLVALGLLLAALALASWLLPQLVNDYLIRVLVVICINGLLVASLGLGNGFTGVFSLGHVGFVAVGAYVSGILSLPVTAKAAYLSHLPGWLAHWSLPFLPASLVAGLVALLLALLVGAPLMRLSGHFVSVATLGFLIIVNVILINANDFTRGARTFTGVPVETTLPWALGWLVVALAILARIAYSPTGRRFRAVREDTIAAQAIGIAVLPTRLVAFAAGSCTSAQSTFAWLSTGTSHGPLTNIARCPLVNSGSALLAVGSRYTDLSAVAICCQSVRATS